MLYNSKYQLRDGLYLSLIFVFFMPFDTFFSIFYLDIQGPKESPAV